MFNKYVWLGVYMFGSEKEYNQIKQDLEKILEEGDKIDKTIAVPAIFAHAMVLAKMRESRVIEG